MIIVSRLKDFFLRLFSSKRLIISTENYVKTIELCRVSQLLIVTILLFCVIVVCFMVLLSAKFYAKVDSKQRKIDQMIQDQMIAKTELVEIIDRIDQMNAYFALLNTRNKEYKLENYNPKDLSSENISEENQSNEKKEAIIDIPIENEKKSEKIELKTNIDKNDNLFDDKKKNLINNNDIDFEYKDISDLKYKIGDISILDINKVLGIKMQSWYKYAKTRYLYIQKILSYLNFLSCSESSMFKRFFDKTNDVFDVLKRFATKGRVDYNESELLEKMKYRICNSGYINSLNINDDSKNYIKDSMFIPSLIKLEKIFSEIPIGNPLINKGRFVGKFGARKDPVYGGRAFHYGIDIAGPYGVKIYSTASGVITRAGWFSGYGLAVDVNHKYGVMTRYAHMSNVAVRVGQKVSFGQLIGYEGSSGKSTGAHVHYEIRINDVAINPIKFVVVSR